MEMPNKFFVPVLSPSLSLIVRAHLWQTVAFSLVVHQTLPSRINRAFSSSPSSFSSSFLRSSNRPLYTAAYDITSDLQRHVNQSIAIATAIEDENDSALYKNEMDSCSVVELQGGSLRTWSTPITTERLQVYMKTQGRPLNANIELWQGPDNTPQKLNVYIEDGDLRPLNIIVETPRGPNSVAIYNTGQMDFPFLAYVETGTNIQDLTASALENFNNNDDHDSLQTIQGGALKSYPFAHFVQSIQVLLKTDGRPLNTRIELLQGPNNQKQVIDIYTEDGMERPFYIIIETPGSRNVLRILNTAPMEYPLVASVEAHRVKQQWK